MPKKIRHIWAKANQYVKVHRQKAYRSKPRSYSDDIDFGTLISGMIVVMVLGWLFKGRKVLGAEESAPSFF